MKMRMIKKKKKEENEQDNEERQGVEIKQNNMEE
jgi:hypothetical protein